MSVRVMNEKFSRRPHWSRLLSILALAPLALAAKGCNSAVVGDECPTDATCNTGTAGSGAGTAGSGAGNGNRCGGLLGAACSKGEYCAYASSAACGAADQTGQCEPRPEVCAEIYQPTCGCDDKTYGNECEAAGAGVSVAHAGECQTAGSGVVCGGLGGAGCAAGEYCDFPVSAQCGAADQTGKCALTPEACDTNLAPVCGCDDVTYSNACAAASAGVSVAAEGECATSGSGCGGRGTGPCPGGQYCVYEPADNCGRSDAPGVCSDIPRGGCTLDYAPVCGCDGQTYGNPCAAATSGVSVEHDGECAPQGEVCGGFVGAGCQAGFYCDYPANQACGFADGTGTCLAKPDACTKELAPVCGCDGTTYGNACMAAAAGVSVQAQGDCKL